MNRFNPSVQKGSDDFERDLLSHRTAVASSDEGSDSPHKQRPFAQSAYVQMDVANAQLRAAEESEAMRPHFSDSEAYEPYEPDASLPIVTDSIPTRTITKESYSLMGREREDSDASAAGGHAYTQIVDEYSSLKHGPTLAVSSLLRSSAANEWTSMMANQRTTKYSSISDRLYNSMSEDSGLIDDRLSQPTGGNMRMEYTDLGAPPSLIGTSSGDVSSTVGNHPRLKARDDLSSINPSSSSTIRTQVQSSFTDDSSNNNNHDSSSNNNREQQNDLFAQYYYTNSNHVKTDSGMTNTEDTALHQHSAPLLVPPGDSTSSPRIGKRRGRRREGSPEALSDPSSNKRSGKVRGCGCCNDGGRRQCECYVCCCFIRLSWRECGFLSCGMVLAVIGCILGFVMFVLLTNHTRHQNEADVPGTVLFVNASMVESDSVVLEWDLVNQHGSPIDFYQLQYASYHHHSGGDGGDGGNSTTLSPSISAITTESPSYRSITNSPTVYPSLNPSQSPTLNSNLDTTTTTESPTVHGRPTNRPTLLPTKHRRRFTRSPTHWFEDNNNNQQSDLNDQGSNVMVDYDDDDEEEGSDSEVESSLDWMNYTLNDDGLYGKATVKHLRGNSTYLFRVRAHNDVGYANWSVPIQIITDLPTEPLPPLYPFGIEVRRPDHGGFDFSSSTTSTLNPMNSDSHVNSSSNIGSTDQTVEFTVAWNVESDGGSPITSFVVWLYPVNDNNNYDDEFDDISDESYEFCVISNVDSYGLLDTTVLYNCSANLTTNMLVEFTVSAENSVGISNESLRTPCIIPSQNIDYFMCLPSKPPDQIDSDNIVIEASPYNIDLQWYAPNSETYIQSYQVQRDDWWNETSLFNITSQTVVPDQGLDLYAKIGSLLPGVPYHIRVRALNQFGPGLWSELMTVFTEDAGYCGNFHDLTQMQKYCTQVDTGMIEIYVKCSGTESSAQAKDKCQKEDMVNEYGFSDDCAECFVEFNDCVMGHCFSQCMQGSPQSCEDCFGVHCTPDTLDCTGYPSWPLWCPN